jgi:hypothetical protein
MLEILDKIRMIMYCINEIIQIKMYLIYLMSICFAFMEKKGC